MFCKNCGGEFDNGSNFCPYCGDKVTPVVAQETAAPEVKQPEAPVQTPVESFVKPPVTEYAPQGGYVPQGGYNPGFVPGAPAPVKKKKSKKALIFVVLFAINKIHCTFAPRKRSVKGYISGTKTIKNRYNYGNEKNLPAFSS